MEDSNWEEVSHMLWNLGYVLYDSEMTPDKREPLTRPAFNVLALPS